MKVKRYLVDDLPQAVQQIRSELGSDAVILNTKEIRTGGFLGMFRKKRMEVIAAVDESAKPQARPSAKPILRQQPEPVKKQPVAQAANEPELDLETDRDVTEPAAQPLPASAIRQKYGGAASGGPTANTEAQPPAGRPNGFSREADGNAGRSILSEPPMESRSTPQASFDEAMSRALASARARVATDRIAGDAELDARSGQPAAEGIPQTEAQTQAQSQTPASLAASPPVASGETAELLAELRAMKDLLRQQSVREQAPQRMPEPVLRLSRLLAQQGVEPAHVEEFAGALTAKLKAREEEDGDAGDAELDRIANEEARQLLQAWLAPAKDSGIAPDTRIVHFVGPTGVGKTTTIAKLGAEQALSRRRAVGFITADTYRIAAVDQLRTYADILNVPLEVVFSPSELARAYKKLEDRDLLLMDTAGRNYRNELYVSEVNSLLSPGQEAEKILVLSLTHKYQDMRQVSAQFVKYGVSRLLLTKMDETDSYGAILNLVREFGFSIPYVTFGQTVPDDIRSFDPAWLADKLLEGAHTHA